ncbi:probable E3 ubiquitin-protein ligase RNF217 isoform X3 [Pistacia vera]|nr:probable E3 ubiquitin-protein ligase RNF217 isoform X2 [Pistacia vera]XP_031267512.1 probable E3 ubiquitin-protein ligase RNF217 isoform X3 [Pistacia vera]
MSMMKPEERSFKRLKFETQTQKLMNFPIEIVDLEDDEFFLTPILQKGGTTKDTAIAVDHYTEDKELQHALMASLFKPTTDTTTTLQNLIHLDNYNDDFDDLHVLNFKPLNTRFSKRRKPFSNPSVTETGQSSNSQNDDGPEFICEICVEPRTANDSFNIKGCSHAYCKDCTAKYVASKLQENITSIPCPVPDCGGSLEPEYCRNILPQDVFDRWGSALCEAVILEAQKFYCPYKDCSALLIDDGGEVISETKCPNCRRKFCAQCKVPWHAGIECREFQELNKDERSGEDIKLMKLALKKKWKRCPYCKYFVEKKSGCMHMKCRCGHAFCYNCGEPYTLTSNGHICPK